MAEYHLTVNAAHTESLAAVLGKVGNKLLVHLSRKHHLNDIHSSLIGVSETVYKLALNSHTLEHLIYLRAAAVNQNGLDANKV